MSRAERIKPDLKFIEELQSVGGADIKKCYQCATCSVVCPLSPMDNSFPRKEMAWAQWGLKDKLVSDIDMWLCHKCGQCSDMCPRGAYPGELMASLRNMAYRSLVGPQFLGRWMSSAKHLPKLIAIPAILYLVIWFITGSMHGNMFPTEHGKIEYGLIFPPLWTIDLVFVPLLFAVLYVFYKGIRNLYAEFDKQPRTFVVGYQKPSNYLVALWQVIKEEVLTHKKWKDCGEEEEENQSKFKGHILLFYSFVVLAIVTGVLSFSFWMDLLFGVLGMPYPMSFFNPLNLLANLGAITLVIGLVYLSKRRLNDSGRDSSSFYDWYLLGIIWVVTITGILSEIFRLAEAVGLTYILYYLHLISVFMLIGYLPWSKLGHLVYRIAALAYARKIGRISTEIESNKNKLYVL